jgi:hypothetical protein
LIVDQFSTVRMLAQGVLLLVTTSQASVRTPVAPASAEVATVSGVVVDGTGQPLENVFVVSHPVFGGTFVHAQTDSSGVFSLTVAKDGMNMVALETEESQAIPEEAQGSSKSSLEGETFAFVRGARTGLRFVLRNTSLVTFVVVDGGTGLPLESFGLGIANKRNLGVHGDIDFQEIPARPHARGRTVAPADPARHVVRVQAPGFASIESDIAADGASDPQTLRLQRGGALIGRVSSAGRPVVRATVLVVRGPIGTVYVGEKAACEPDSWYRADYRRDLEEYVGRPRLVESNEEGTFRVADLSPGTYDVVVEAPDLGPNLSKRIRVEAGETRDLGDLKLGAPAVLHGRVLVGPGVSPVGLEYFVDGRFRRRNKIAEPDGSFVVQGLGPGVHQLTLVRSVLCPDDDVREIRVASGETREVVFDLSKAR